MDSLCPCGREMQVTDTFRSGEELIGLVSRCIGRLFDARWGSSRGVFPVGVIAARV